MLDKTRMIRTRWYTRLGKRLKCFFKGHDETVTLRTYEPVGTIPARHGYVKRCRRCMKVLEEYGDERLC